MIWRRWAAVPLTSMMMLASALAEARAGGWHWLLPAIQQI
jgi:hypothetical protein